MNYLIVEMLMYLIAASVLGVVVGWGLKTLFSRRRLANMKAKWKSQRFVMEESFDIEISELKNTNLSLVDDNKLLNNKCEALSASVDLGDQALQKSMAENTELKATIESQQSTMQQAQSDAEQIALKQDEIQQQHDAILVSMKQEIKSLRQQLATRKSDSSSFVSVAGGTPDGGSIIPAAQSSNQQSTENLDIKIEALNVERQRLAKQREKFVAREAHFASQLVHGEDTQAYMDETAYFDETIRIDDYKPHIDPLPGPEGSFKKNATVTLPAVSQQQTPTHNKPERDSNRSSRSMRRRGSSQRFRHKAGQEKELVSINGDPEPAKPKTLWDKVKTGVAKTVEKTRN